MATKEIRNLKLERERIRSRHVAGDTGTFVVRQLSDALDSAVIGLWERIADDRCALIALGEYGRQELSPASSLDLLVLHPWGTDPTDAAKALSYELWAAELDLGYALYTPEEALRLVRTRVDSELRFLDARLLVGDAELFKGWKAELMEYSRGSSAGFLDRLAPVTRARRSSTDDACSCLEPDPSETWPSAARESFVGLLSTGPEGRAGFRALERTGALATALPEWTGIRCLPQRSVYHRYAVDVHCYEVVAELAELRSGAAELTRRVARESEADRETLLLAGLLHDIGKGSEEDHCLRGETLARSAIERMGIEEPQASEVVWLVRNHLLLSRVATRRDLGDEALAIELADRIGSERRLRLLYLLTVADARATGPAAWSTWKATLISRLYSRVSHVLRRGELAGADTSEVAADKIEALKAALADYPPAVLERHLSGMPKAWLLSQDMRGLVDQSIQMLEYRRGDELRIRAVANPDAGIWELTIVANDRPGLFGKVSGVLALHDLSVL